VSVIAVPASIIGTAGTPLTKNAGTAVSAERSYADEAYRRSGPAVPGQRREQQADGTERRPDQGDLHRRTLAVGEQGCGEVGQGQDGQDE
jgi:hypothetical protein